MSKRLRSLLFLVLVAVGATQWPYSTRAADHRVATIKELDNAINDAQPGDTITLRNGAWGDFDILFDAEGTAESPITLRAQTPGKVVISGPTALRIGGRHLAVSGL